MVDYLSKYGRLLKRLKRPCWKRGRRVTACVGSNPMSSVYFKKDTQEIESTEKIGLLLLMK